VPSPVGLRPSSSNFLASKHRKLLVKDPSAKVQVTLLATNRTEYLVPTWDKFIEVVKRAMEGNDTIPGLDGFLSNLPERIKMSTVHGFTANSIGHFQRIVRNEQVLMKVGTHSEAALALLALYPDLEANVVKYTDGSISDVCKVGRLALFCVDNFPDSHHRRCCFKRQFLCRSSAVQLAVESIADWD